MTVCDLINASKQETLEPKTYSELKEILWCVLANFIRTNHGRDNNKHIYVLPLNYPEMCIGLSQNIFMLSFLFLSPQIQLTNFQWLRKGRVEPFILLEV